MKAVKTHLQEKKPEEVEEFEKGAQAFAKKIVGNFKDYEFVSLPTNRTCHLPEVLCYPSTPENP